MNERHELPLEDRSPSDGELFSLQYLYLLQSRKVRALHAVHLSGAIYDAIEAVDFVGRELHQRTGTVFDDTDDELPEEFSEWSWQVGRHMSEEDLREQRRASEDRLYRALGQLSLTYGSFRALFFHAGIGTPPTSQRW